MTESIKHQFFFPHPAEAVWAYLTNTELMELWLMKNDFQPVIGHNFQFRTNPVPSLNFSGIFYCKVLDIVPFKKLSYSWKCGPEDGSTSIDSIVFWTLQPRDQGTDLFLEHSGFTVMENFALYHSMIDGWLKNIHKIADRLNASKHGATNS